MKYSKLLIVFFMILGVNVARAEIGFKLEFNDVEVYQITESGQTAYCSDSVKVFVLHAEEFEDQINFELFYENPVTNAYLRIPSRFDTHNSLTVDINNDNLPGIDGHYRIVSLDSIQDYGTLIWDFYIDLESSGGNFPSITAAEWIREKYPSMRSTHFGVEIPENSSESDYCGSRYTHIFFDQYGNSLCSVVPQGIPGRQYIVHVVYLVCSEGEPVDYLVNQTEGVFLDSYVLRNVVYADSLITEMTAIPSSSRGGDQSESEEPSFHWTESITRLNTSTTDIQIDIFSTSYQEGLETDDNRTLVATRGIHMTPVYHGSLDMGIVNSTLSDPDYSLIMQSDSTGVVRISDDGDRGMVTVMATMYSSPVVWIQSLFNKEIPSYKLYGRNFLDDHAWYQRFYPTIGLELSSSALESFFGGLSFEFARGGNLFAGIHYGKVSRMNLPEGFIEGQSQMTEEEFNLRLDQEWNIGFAYGLSLDIGVLTKLFGGLSL